MTRATILAICILAVGLAALTACGRATDDPGTPPDVTARGSTGRVVSMQSGAVADGNGAALSMTGADKAAIQYTAGFTAQLNFEATVDGSNWAAIELCPATDANCSSAASYISVANAAAIWLLPSGGGLISVRARVSGADTGTLAVKGRVY